MAAITKCAGQEGGIICPYREKCYRFTAKADEYQSYFKGIPLKDNKCDLYWGDNNENIWNQLKEITTS